jgi:hypothetical protein
MTIDKKNSGNAAHKFVSAATDEELLDQLDELVAHAAKGERDAVGAILIAFGPRLLDEAREALGPAHEQDAGDVLAPRRGSTPRQRETDVQGAVCLRSTGP